MQRRIWKILAAISVVNLICCEAQGFIGLAGAMLMGNPRLKLPRAAYEETSKGTRFLLTHLLPSTDFARREFLHDSGSRRYLASIRG